MPAGVQTAARRALQRRGGAVSTDFQDIARASAWRLKDRRGAPFAARDLDDDLLRTFGARLTALPAQSPEGDAAEDAGCIRCHFLGG